MIAVVLLSVFALVAAFAVAVCARIESRAEVLAATTILWVGMVVGPIYVLGLPGLLTRTSLALASIAVSGLTLAATWRLDRGDVGRELRSRAGAVLAMPRDALALAVRERSTVLLGLIASAFFFLWNVVGAYLMPSWRSWDALWYHEPIVGFTIQNHGFQVVDLSMSGHQKINGYPRVGEMLSLWFGIFAGRRLIDLPEVLLMPGLFCAVFATCRRHCGNVLSCLGWAAAVVTVPAYVQELQTVFIDCALPVFVSCGFLFATSRPLRTRDVLLAALALALAANTKVFGVFPAVTVCIFVAGRLLMDRSAPLGRRLAALLGGAAIVVGWSCATYLRNLILFHNPVWPELPLSVPALGIHWPGLGGWGQTLTSANPEQLNLNAPLDVTISEFLTRPYGVTDRVRTYVYQYGLGAQWVLMPMIVVAGIVEIARFCRQWITRRLGSAQGSADRWSSEVGVLAAVTIVVIVYTTTAIWSPRYHLHTLALGVVLICIAFGAPRWSATSQALSFATVLMSLMGTWWDYPIWRSFLRPELLWRAIETPYPNRELDPDLGAPVRLDAALARERELVAGTIVVNDDYLFPALLWNNDYSNRVVDVRASDDIVKAADRWNATWVHVGGPDKAKALVATGKWQILGPLFVDGTGIVLHRKQ